jgi:hypothetical protein
VPRFDSLGRRLFGEPPSDGAPRLERLRYIRRLYLRPLPVNLLGYVLIAIYLPGTTALVLLGFPTAVWLSGLTRLGLQIRREERGEEH